MFLTNAYLFHQKTNTLVTSKKVESLRRQPDLPGSSGQPWFFSNIWLSILRVTPISPKMVKSIPIRISPSPFSWFQTVGFYKIQGKKLRLRQQRNGASLFEFALLLFAFGFATGWPCVVSACFFGERRKLGIFAFVCRVWNGMNLSLGWLVHVEVWSCLLISLGVPMHIVSPILGMPKNCMGDLTCPCRVSTNPTALTSCIAYERGICTRW